MSISEIIDNYLIGKSLKLVKTTIKKTVENVDTIEVVYSEHGYSTTNNEGLVVSQNKLTPYTFEVLQQEPVTLQIVEVDVNPDYDSIEVAIELEGGLNWRTNFYAELPLI